MLKGFLHLFDPLLVDVGLQGLLVFVLVVDNTEIERVLEFYLNQAVL